jgi:hypothetical protein
VNDFHQKPVLTDQGPEFLWNSLATNLAGAADDFFDVVCGS